MYKSLYIIFILTFAVVSCKHQVPPVTPYHGDYYGGPAPTYTQEPAAPLPYNTSQPQQNSGEPEYIVPIPADNDSSYYPLYYYD